MTHTRRREITERLLARYTHLGALLVRDNEILCRLFTTMDIAKDRENGGISRHSSSPERPSWGAARLGGGLRHRLTISSSPGCTTGPLAAPASDGLPLTKEAPAEE